MIYDMAMVDFKEGKSIKCGRTRKRTYFCGIIDDCSRFLVGHEWGVNEDTALFARTLKRAIAIYGIPKILYCDQGKVFLSIYIVQVCARLGISLVHAQPYSAACKGKIERFNGTISRMFYPVARKIVTIMEKALIHGALNKKQVGCCGRVVPPGILPKYLFSKDFKKSFHLYNIQNIVPHRRMPVFIVEGFFDCIHVIVNGFDCAALMGNSISTYQLKLLKEMERNYILMLDGDGAGRKATQRVVKQMEQNGLPFKVVRLSNDLEPEALGYDDLLGYSRQGN
jgi:hypothetical protein